VFFTAAVGPHRMFVLPYIYSVLRHDPDVAVEIIVEDCYGFIGKNAGAISLFDPTRITFQDTDWPAKDANYLRFLRQPKTKAPYVYIGDIDILILDKGITQTHVDNSRKLGLPYSNIVRASGDRLTGLHFTEWSAMYPITPPPISDLRRVPGDEHLLFQMIEERGLGMPEGDFRPTHGIHMSLNRKDVINDPANPNTWGVTPDRWTKYLELRDEPGWQALLPKFDPAYRDLLDLLEREGMAFYGD
jgi:hypothetical protein